MFNDAYHMPVLLIVILLIVLLLTLIRLRTKGFFRLRSRRIRVDSPVDARYQDFDGLLARYNPYYQSLTHEGRRRFLTRVLQFMEHKKFEYIDIQAEDRMPLLVSAAAIQLTFGLDHFQLDFFRTIYIIKDKYRYGLYNTPFEGHVSEDGIYLSWTHFIREFTDYSDGQNVGLHEMAHALSYVNFTVREGRDNTFHDSFTGFSAVARPIFERMQAGETNLLGSYAATSYHEFWAVCVETFFERSATFKRQLPELYLSLCTLLNQDPLTPDKLITLPPSPRQILKQ
jgi:Mlc titration factor MtfA (ptsG expression regulator)